MSSISPTQYSVLTGKLTIWMPVISGAFTVTAKPAAASIYWTVSICSPATVLSKPETVKPSLISTMLPSEYKATRVRPVVSSASPVQYSVFTGGDAISMPVISGAFTVTAKPTAASKYWTVSICSPATVLSKPETVKPSLSSAVLPSEYKATRVRPVVSSVSPVQYSVFTGCDMISMPVSTASSFSSDSAATKVIDGSIVAKRHIISASTPKRLILFIFIPRSSSQSGQADGSWAQEHLRHSRR